MCEIIMLSLRAFSDKRQPGEAQFKRRSVSSLRQQPADAALAHYSAAFHSGCCGVDLVLSWLYSATAQVGRSKPA